MPLRNLISFVDFVAWSLSQLPTIEKRTEES